MKSLKESASESFKIMINTMSNMTSQKINSGFAKLDDLVRGMNRGSFTILTSSYMDKTAFALNIIGNWMQAKNTKRILYCSDLEHGELTNRLMNIISNSMNYRYGNDRNNPIHKMNAFIGSVGDYPLFFHELHDDMGTVIREIKELHAENNFEFLILDHIRPEDCPLIKMLARELHIPILALVSMFTEKDEMLCRRNADTLITLLQNHQQSDSVLPVKVIVSKNKNGVCGSCQMDFDPKTMIFQESCLAEVAIKLVPEIFERLCANDRS